MQTPGRHLADHVDDEARGVGFRDEPGVRRRAGEVRANPARDDDYHHLWIHLSDDAGELEAVGLAGHVDVDAGS